MGWPDWARWSGWCLARLAGIPSRAALGGRFAVDLALLALLVAAFLSGLIAAGEGLNRFVVHLYAAYGLLGMAVLHVFLERQPLLRRLRALLGAGPPGQTSPIRPDARGQYATRDGERGPALSPSPGHGVRPARRHLLAAGGGALVGVLFGRLWPAGPSADLHESGDLGLTYHQWSAPSYVGAISRALSWGAPPELERRIADVKTFVLPRDMAVGGMSLEQAVERRRSVRDYATRPLDLRQVSRLMHSAAGLTDQSSRFRAAPSAGALYPLEVYAVANRVEGLDRGLYRYDPASHSLGLLREGDLRSDLLQACLGQGMVASAGLVVVLSAVFQRTRWKYGERAYRYVLLEAGHVGQNLYLAATALGLGACAIGAFYDDQVNRLLGVDGADEAAVYVISVGAPSH